MRHLSPEDSTAHWSRLCQGFQASTYDFYDQVEAAIAKRSIPDVEIERIEYSEGGALSAKREYLRVRRRRDVFDICGAPFGDGFFFSWWMAEVPPSPPAMVTLFLLAAYIVFAKLILDTLGYFEGPALMLVGAPILIFLLSRFGDENTDDLIMALPFFGSFYRRFFRPITYYRLDTADMFQQAVEKTVMGVIDQMTAAKGIRALTELERKPALRLYAKA